MNSNTIKTLKFYVKQFRETDAAYRLDSNSKEKLQKFYDAQEKLTDFICEIADYLGEEN